MFDLGFGVFPGVQAVLGFMEVFWGSLLFRVFDVWMFWVSGFVRGLFLGVFGGFRAFWLCLGVVWGVSRVFWPS